MYYVTYQTGILIPVTLVPVYTTDVTYGLMRWCSNEVADLKKALEDRFLAAAREQREFGVEEVEERAQNEVALGGHCGRPCAWRGARRRGPEPRADVRHCGLWVLRLHAQLVQLYAHLAHASLDCALQTASIKELVQQYTVLVEYSYMLNESMGF